MRVPDSLLQTSFLNTYNKSKATLADIQTKLTTQSKVNKPSDNPLSNARIMRMQDQLTGIDTYKNNVSYASSILNDSILSMESMQNEVQNILVELTQLNSAIVNDDLSSFAESVDASIEILVDLANSDFNGQYSFGGTESQQKPFYYDKTNNVVVNNSEYIGGEKVVKISSGITQKFNITGKELFQSVYKQTGNLNSEAGVGVAQTETTKIYGADAKEYNLDLTYTMTESNTYELNYVISDLDGNVIDDQTVEDIKFNADTGSFESIGGEKFGEIQIKNSASKIDFVLDVNSLKEKDSSESLNGSLSQKADIFNSLISIKEQLLNGEKPSSDLTAIVSDFNQHILNKLSAAGGISNKLQSQEEILTNKEMEISELLSLEKDVDVAKALLDLESAQYTLDISYQISSMILPKSLMDFF